MLGPGQYTHAMITLSSASLPLTSVLALVLEQPFTTPGIVTKDVVRRRIRVDLMLLLLALKLHTTVNSSDNKVHWL